MQDLFNRRDFLVTGSAGLAGAAQLFSFPLAANAQGVRSASIPRGTYVRADADMDLLFLSGTTALDLYHLHPHVPYEITMPDDAISCPPEQASHPRVMAMSRTIRTGHRSRTGSRTPVPGAHRRCRRGRSRRCPARLGQ